MKTQPRAKTRLYVEELEGRLVLSSTLQSAIVPSLFEAAHATSASVSTTSTNWSGYAAETNLNAPASGSVSAVTGTWTVPTVTGSGTAYSSVWVGIDGYSSSTVEQLGTEQDVVNGQAQYYAWYEMYPSNSVNITTLTVQPGNTISASVTYASGKFALQLTDTTTGKSFSISESMSGRAILRGVDRGSTVIGIRRIAAGQFRHGDFYRRLGDDQ